MKLDTFLKSLSNDKLELWSEKTLGEIKGTIQEIWEDEMDTKFPNDIEYLRKLYISFQLCLSIEKMSRNGEVVVEGEMLISDLKQSKVDVKRVETRLE